VQTLPVVSIKIKVHVAGILSFAGDESPNSLLYLLWCPLLGGLGTTSKPGKGGSLDSLLGLCWHGWGGIIIFLSVYFIEVEKLLFRSLLCSVCPIQIFWLMKEGFGCQDFCVYLNFCIVCFFSSSTMIYKGGKKTQGICLWIIPQVWKSLASLPSPHLSESLMCNV
jgi:hypothetical protein